jgi:alpha-methylacyl-CoA racemase
MRAGPLAGVRVIEIAGIGPGPFAAMLLADLGADVLRVDRKDGAAIARAMGMDFAKDISNRGRPSVALDLKHPEAVAMLLDLLKSADALIEGFRPGVMEGLGLGPEACLERNPKLVYGRMTGWGQTGPLARRAGHDINYIAMSGMLHTFARQNERPVPPGNTVGDMGGGGLMLAFGVVSALLEARGSGRGQVVDAAMFEGAALLGTSVFVMMAMGLHDVSRPGTNLGDTGAHFYEVYETRDARYVAVGAIEPQFYSQLLKGLGLDAASLPKQMDARTWPDMKRRFADIFRTKTRAEWEQVFAGTDACVSPVLSPVEAAENPHARSRGSFSDAGGVLQPAPAPRFSRTPAALFRAPSMPGADTYEALAQWGVPGERVAALRAAGAIN